LHVALAKKGERRGDYVSFAAFDLSSYRMDCRRAAESTTTVTALIGTCGIPSTASIEGEHNFSREIFPVYADAEFVK
jgi:hypothetical protein